MFVTLPDCRLPPQLDRVRPLSPRRGAGCAERGLRVSPAWAAQESRCRRLLHQWPSPGMERTASRLSGNWSVELLIYALEGIAPEEYQLIRFREHSDSREFRSVTGGVFHESGGANRDTVPFVPTRVGVRTWRVTLEHLTPGEYGFLPPVNSTNLAASGKMYTFRLGTDPG